MEKAEIKSRMKLMLIAFAILFSSIFLSKFISGWLNARRMAAMAQTVNVSAMKAGYSSWQSIITASGSLRAIQGVSVTSELAGMVNTILFVPGAIVQQGDLLVQLNINADVAQLHSLQANAELAKITYDRDFAQFKAKGVSKAVVDSDAANLKSLNAQVEQQIATIAKKTIRAPFAGRLGISAVNLGQYVNPGDKVVTLQQLDPIYVDFYVPQQQLAQLAVGMPVTVKSDAFPGKTFFGKVTTIDPLIDVNTRNVEVEATISNPDFSLAPGMFATTQVTIGEPKKYLTLPQTAITFNPYGDIVYVIEKSKDENGKSILIANQSFVTTGETRGDQIAILKGLKAGDVVVTSGQLKLKNHMQVVINNSVVPANNPAPKVINE